MKAQTHKKHPAGYTSLLLVFTTSIFMLAIMIFAYRRAADAQATLADIQVQTDYREKEEVMLRSIVALTPNRAIQVMQDGSDSSAERRDAVSFESIFQGAVTRANARTSVSAALLEEMEAGDAIVGNSGDSALTDPSRIFSALTEDSGRVTSGLNRDLGEGFPPALDFTGSLADSDNYPVISDLKTYGNYASGEVALPTNVYADYNLIPYPDIDFGYSQPGELFVAKRNWWGFRMNLASHDRNLTNLANPDRTFVLSIYEIPSQLPISGSAFMSFGQHADGEAWQNVAIDGNVFAGRAQVEGTTSLASIASRRDVQLSDTATIGGQSFSESPFAPGVRETFRLTQGEFFPVSLASESGKAAFIPINRGLDFFDRYAHAAETSTISPTTWNDYSVGALQCAMRLDITKCFSADDPLPTELTFSYLKDGIRQTLTLPWGKGLEENPEPFEEVPPYIFAANEFQSRDFETAVDLAYGADGNYLYKDGVSGTVNFNNLTFRGDPAFGVAKVGYYRPLYPFSRDTLPDGKDCIAVYPERFKDFLNLIGADGPDVNNSISINVDYVNNADLTKPLVPSTAADYGVILQECGDLTTFTKGFSLVTNLRLHIGDDFNIVPMTPPDGYTPLNGADFYPPCSLFAPEKRYGVEQDPIEIQFTGQIGSAASENAAVPVRPLDAKGVSGLSMSAGQINVNLSKLNHPAELPPISMMNWLVVLEELRD